MSIVPIPVIGPSALRVIGHLETLPPGAEASTTGLLDALPGTKVVPLLRELEIAAGLGHVRRRKRVDLASAPWWWSLPQPERRTLARAPTPMAHSAPDPAPQHRAMGPTQPQSAAGAGSTRTQPSRRSSARHGLNGDPGRLASAAAQAILSAPPAPNLSETQAATPSGDLRFCMWHDGTFECWDAEHRLARFTPEQTLQLAEYFGAVGAGNPA